jgi:hypothetical protein
VPESVTAFQQSKKLYKVFFSPPAELTTRSGGRMFLSLTQVFSAGPDPKREGELRFQRAKYSSCSVSMWHQERFWHITGIRMTPSCAIRTCISDPYREFSLQPLASAQKTCVPGHQGPRCKAKDETLRVDSHFGKEQEGIREDGDMESSPSCLAVDMVLTHYRESATRSFISFMP